MNNSNQALLWDFELGMVVHVDNIMVDGTFENDRFEILGRTRDEESNQIYTLQRLSDDQLFEDVPACVIIAPRIYIAGFDVFYPDAIKRGIEMKQICSKYGFFGLFPFDNEADNPQDIRSGNLKLISSADYIIANLNPFRGMEMDSGTAFELGWAYANGKALYGYMDDIRPMVEKIGTKDNLGLSVENFGHPLNLMIAGSTIIVKGGFEDCVCELQQSILSVE